LTRFVYHAAYTLPVSERHLIQISYRAFFQRSSVHRLGLQTVLYKNIIVGAGSDHYKNTYFNAGFRTSRFILQGLYSFMPVRTSTASKRTVEVQLSFVFGSRKGVVPFEKM
jgi:hypothetical protein